MFKSDAPKVCLNFKSAELAGRFAQSLSNSKEIMNRQNHYYYDLDDKKVIVQAIGLEAWCANFYLTCAQHAHSLNQVASLETLSEQGLEAEE